MLYWSLHSLYYYWDARTTAITTVLTMAADNISHEVTLSTPDSFLQFFNQYDEPGLGAVTYAQAYYAAIDPANKRDTLNKFISHHENDGSDWIHVIFRDTQDLGYGRDMYMRNHNNANGCPEIAFYVRNFVVAPVPGFDYGPLNLDAAIKNDTKFHFGTNAIEVSRADDDVALYRSEVLKILHLCTYRRARTLRGSR